MALLEYELGTIDVNQLSEGRDGNRKVWYIDTHKFVVGVNDNTAIIYVADLKTHPEVAKKFDVPETCIVGGGKFYYSGAHRAFCLEGYSPEYGAIPKKAAEKFVRLIGSRLTDRFPLYEGKYWAYPEESRINPFWQDKEL